MAVTITDYSERAVRAARSVLLELSHILGPYRESFVIVGGWVPELLLTDADRRHTGSTDVDVAVNHRSLHEPAYQKILSILQERGYRQSHEQPFIFFREVSIDEQEIIVEVDFLAGEYAGSSKGHRTQTFEELRARKARGCDLVFEMNTEVDVIGELPGGGKDQSLVRVASIPSFLVMKGMALADRIKEKDAWDIYYCLLHYPGGITSLAGKVSPSMKNKLVREGIAKIAAKFQSPVHFGPKAVADFEEITDPESLALLQRDAYERVQAFITAPG